MAIHADPAHRSLTYSAVIACVRVLAVGQAIALPFATALDIRITAALVCYCIVAALIAQPWRDPATDGSGSSAAQWAWVVIALDIAAAAAVAWYSGFSLLIMVPALDAAVPRLLRRAG